MRLRFNGTRLRITALCSVVAICGGLTPGVEILAQIPPITLAPVITTAAGNGTAGGSGDGGPAIFATLNGPADMAVDPNGAALYIADAYNSRIRKVSANGIISTLTGNGSCLFSGDGGPASAATVCQPYGLAVDAAGNVYIADTYNHRIRKVDGTTGIITTIAGIGSGGFSGDGGPAINAAVNSPTEVSLDAAGNIYIADRGNYRVRKINTSGIISTVAGNGAAGFSGDGGPAVNASLNTVWSVDVDTAGNIYISDIYNSRVRKINTSGIISTVTGGSYGFSGDGALAVNAQISNVYGLGVDPAGNLYIADTYNNRVRKVDLSGNISTIIGNGIAAFGGDGGAPINAQINNPYSVKVGLSGDIYVADINNQRIRRIRQTLSSFGSVAVGQSSAPQTIYVQINQALTISSIAVPQSEGGPQEYSIGALAGCTIGAVLPVGTICSIPVTFTPAFPGTRSAPLVFTTTSAGIVSFGLTGVGLSSQVAILPGIINTVAGNGNAGFSGDNGPALSAGLPSPQSVARDIAGNTYIATSDNRVRKITLSTGNITTVAGNGGTTYSGDNGPATAASFVSLSGAALDGAGNLYLTDKGGHRIRKVDVNGVITTFAGTGTSGSTGDNGPATSATLNGPTGIAVDTTGNVFFSDSGNFRVRRIATNGTITTVVGTGTAGTGGDGGPAISAQLKNPQGLAFDPNGNLYIVDRGGASIRKVAVGSGVITTVAGGGTTAIPPAGTSAIGAQMDPVGIATDAGGDLYIADPSFPGLFKVDAATGIIRNIAGVVGSAGFSGDGGAATSAQLNQPSAVALDATGDAYIADTANNRIRQVSISAAPVSFPDTAIGQTSSAKSVALSNIGNGDLGITGYTGTPDFLVDPAGTCSSVTVLPSATSCNIAIDFAPQLIGARSGNIVVTDSPLSLAASTQNVPVSGNGLKATTTTLVTISTDSTIFSGTPVTFSATISPHSAGAVVAGGTVTFLLNGIPVGPPQTISATGVATFTALTLGPGTYVPTTTYSGDANFTASTGTGPTMTVEPTIVVDIESSANPSVYGQPISVTATVSNSTTGTVNFKVDGIDLGNVPIIGTTATISLPLLPPGPHIVSSTANGDATHLAASSDVLTQIVNPATLTITATDVTRSYNQPNGTLPFTVTGFVGTDNFANSVTGTPSLSTPAAALSPVGDYSIFVSLGSLASSKYIFQFHNGTLHASPATTVILLASTGNPSVWGQPITFSTTLPTNASGSITFMDGGSVLGTATIINNIASISTMLLSVGTHSITATYAGDINYAPASAAAISQVVNKTVLELIPTDTQRIYGQPNPSFTALYSGFVNGEAEAAISGTPALTTTATLTSPAGSYLITATAGTLTSTNYAFDFLKGTLLIVPATPGVGPTAPVNLASLTNPIALGAAAIFTATLPPGATGIVSFFDGSTLLGAITTVAQTATFSTSTLSVGTHSITVVYGGDANYNAATSPILLQIVNKATTTSISLTTLPNPSTYGSSVNFTATVPPAATGTVTFFDSTTMLGTGTVTAGTATFATNTLQAGTHPITAQYGGDSNYSAGSSTPPSQLVINRALSSISVTATPNPAVTGTPVTLTAIVPVGPTGTVTFYDGTIALGTVAIGGTKATINGVPVALAVSTFSPGTHPITAAYNGDTNYATAVSTVVPLLVTASATADFTITSPTAPQLIPPGASASYTILVSSVGLPFTSAITLAAANLPPGATYSYSPATVTPGAAGASSILVVTVPQQAAALHRSSHTPLLLAALLLPFAFCKRYRDKPQRLLVWILIAFTSFSAMTGCGSGGYFSQTQQTYTITATGTSGTLVRSTTITLTVE